MSACAGRTDKNPLDVQAVPVVETLSEKVQKLITAQQDAFLKALPEKIDALNASGAIADYEKNKRGGGLSRSYDNTEAKTALTVFVYNGYDFGIDEGVTDKAHAAMDDALKKFRIYQETGLYKNVRVEPVVEKEMKVRGNAYPFLRTTVSFSVKGEKKISYVALIPCRPLLSYIRLQLTYPVSFAATRLQNAALRAVTAAAAQLSGETKTAGDF